MNFSDLPVVFISYDEPNRDVNWSVLKKQNIVGGPLRVHGVTGFDAAHKAACAEALRRDPDTKHFFTVDGDTTILDWVWNSSYEDLLRTVSGGYIDIDKAAAATSATTFSWRSINNINGLAYGNGGLKLWSVDFVQKMRTHEAVVQVPGEDVKPVIDFCWDRNYWQMAAIAGVTRIDGSPYQAWRAGFREGVKMPLQNGTATPRYAADRIDINSDLTMQRFLHWSTVGEDCPKGVYAINGALSGFVYAHITSGAIDTVLDYSKLSTLFEDVPEGLPRVLLSNTYLRELVSKRLSYPIPRFGHNQSKTVKLMLSYPKLSMYARETWARIPNNDYQ